MPKRAARSWASSPPCSRTALPSRAAAQAYLASPDAAAVSALQQAVESPRQEFFRRLNLAPGATAQIVAMRRDLLSAGDAALAQVDRDLMHLLASWFNRGFLVLRRIDWQTPAAILEKIIEYEAVHEIQGWDDLRRRLDPDDRRCFAFFHPSLVDEPLIFVEVALMRDIPDDIQSLLREAPKNGEAKREADDGRVLLDLQLPGRPARHLVRQFPHQAGGRGAGEGACQPQDVRDAVARSAVCELARAHAGRGRLHASSTRSSASACACWRSPTGSTPTATKAVRPLLMRLAAHYFLNAKNRDGYPVDPVARFHLGNGARLERINWQGDISAKGLREAHGLMCNYRYELKDIEKNHEAYENEAAVAASRQVHNLLKLERGRSEQPAGSCSCPACARPGPARARKRATRVFRSGRRLGRGCSRPDVS